jgi:predicted dehydrogenase
MGNGVERMTAKQQLRMGVIGAGRVSELYHLPGFHGRGSDAPIGLPGLQFYPSDSEVVALCDIDEPRAAALAERFGVEKVYNDWRELLTDRRVDAVCIATANFLHAEMAIAAAEADKHVFVEKPMATTLEDMDRMIDAAEARGVVLMVNQSWRFNVAMEAGRDLVNAGMLGRVRTVRTKFGMAGPKSWSPTAAWYLRKEQAGGGAMMDIGSHAFDYLRYLVGDEVAEVGAFTATLAQATDGEDNCLAILKFRNDVLAVCEVSWTTNPGENRTFVYGEHGNMAIEAMPRLMRGTPVPQVLVDFQVPAEAVGAMRVAPGKLERASFSPDLPAVSRLGGPYRQFVESVSSGKPPMCSGRESRASMAVVLAAMESGRTGQFVRLDMPRHPVQLLKRAES